jgi:hypothetical protein
LSTALQIVLFLPLTLVTLSKQAFLLHSLLLGIHAIIHGTMLLFWNTNALSILQLPMHPFLLLVCFNAFSQSVHASLLTAATWWGKLLTFLGPAFIAMEGLSSLLVVQNLGQEGRRLIRDSEREYYQFALLIATAVAYVISAWWIVVVSVPRHTLEHRLLTTSLTWQSYPSAASSPLSSTLLGVALTSFVFLTFIGFVLRRTNIIESSGLALFIAYNIWLCGFDQDSFSNPSSS